MPRVSQHFVAYLIRDSKDQDHYAERCWYAPQRQQRAPAAGTPTEA
jgi:hypothetical protein